MSKKKFSGPITVKRSALTRYPKTALALSIAAVSGLPAANAADIQIGSSTSGANTSIIDSNNNTNNFLLHGTNATLQTNGSLSVLYGNIDGFNDAGESQGSVIIGGNLTMHGNVGGTNATGNFTLNNGNTLTLASNASVFNSANTTLQSNTVLNMGNASTGYNRGTSETLTFSSNVSMANNSTINIGGGTTLAGNIYGASNGQGTLNIQGNVTSGITIGHRQIDGVDTGAILGLEQVNVSTGNTFTNNGNVTATRMNINGTVTSSGNITAAVTMGTSGVLNLNSQSGGTASGKVVGTINGLAARGGTLNINGTYTTGGVIGGTYGLTAIQLDASANQTVDQAVTFAHSVNATSIYLGKATTQNNQTLTMNSTTTGENIVVTGTIYGSGNSSAKGLLRVSNATVNGGIGSSTRAMGTVYIAGGANANTLTITSGDVTADNITFGGASSTLAINGTTTITGALDAESAPGKGILDVNDGGTLTMTGVIGGTYGLEDITIDDGGTINLSSNVNVNEQVTVLGTMRVTSAISINATHATTAGENGTVFGNTTGDNATFSTNSTVTFKSGDVAFNNSTILLNGQHNAHTTAATGYIDISTDNRTLNLGGHITIDLDTDNSGPLASGTNVYIASNGTINIQQGANVTIADTKFLEFSINNGTIGYGDNRTGVNGYDGLYVTVTYNNASTLNISGSNRIAAYDAAATAIGTDKAVFNALAGFTTDAQFQSAAETFAPDTSGAAAAGSHMVTVGALDTISSRLSMARATGLGKGLAAGDAALRESMWLQGFASDVNQDAEGQFSGYDASGAGLALGMDTLLDDSVTRIGIAGSYASTSVDGRHASRKDATDIDTLQLSAYMTRDYGDMYIDGMVALAFNDNDASRHVVVGSVDRTASATYDSTLAALRMAAGWKLAQEGGLSITPEVSVTYSHLSSDSYTETGAGNFNLTVNPEDVDMFEGRLGLAIESESKGADGSILRPQFRIGVAHDFAADGAGSTATFAGGGSSFTVTGHERDSTMIDLGAGLTYTTPDRSTDVILNVDGRFADGYDSLGGGLTVRWKF